MSYMFFYGLEKVFKSQCWYIQKSFWIFPLEEQYVDCFIHNPVHKLNPIERGKLDSGLMGVNIL